MPLVKKPGLLFANACNQTTCRLCPLLSSRPAYSQSSCFTFPSLKPHVTSMSLLPKIQREVGSANRVRVPPSLLLPHPGGSRPKLLRLPLEKANSSSAQHPNTPHTVCVWSHCNTQHNPGPHCCLHALQTPNALPLLAALLLPTHASAGSASSTAGAVPALQNNKTLFPNA